jgi:hypothetical protein
VAIDLPELPFAHWKQATSVPLGRPVLVGVASDPGAPGKARACVVVASEFAWP